MCCMKPPEKEMPVRSPLEDAPETVAGGVGPTWPDPMGRFPANTPILHVGGDSVSGVEPADRCQVHFVSCAFAFAAQDVSGYRSRICSQYFFARSLRPFCSALSAMR